MAQTMEKSKDTKLSVGSIIKKMDKKTLCFDHPLQRESERWNKVMVSNLISDILQGNPIPELVFAEQIVNGIPIIWNLDGKQRCTNLYMYYKGIIKHDKISKNVRRYMITYHTPILDENGEIAVDGEGFPLYEKKEFDIRNKKFCQLPEELQERFLDYSFKIVQYINCTSEDIAYHILRYNEGKPANKEEKGIIRLGERFARIVKSIAELPFFKDNYTPKQFNNGAVNRIITESMMLSNFFEEYNGNYDKTCDYIREHATADQFEAYEDIICRLEKCVDDENMEVFTGKNAFLFITLAARFVNSGLEDSRFNDFLTVFIDKLFAWDIDGVSFDDLMEDKSTKDKNIVIARIEHLTTLMCNYLKIDADSLNSIGITDEEFEDLAQEFVADEMAYKALMLISDCPYCSFDNDTLVKMDNWLKTNGSSDLIGECKYYRAIVSDCGVSDDNENLPIYMYAVKYCDTNGIAIDIDEWIVQFDETLLEVGVEDETSNETIVLKQQVIINNINNFITKGE